jgi:hypothetical protein
MKNRVIVALVFLLALMTVGCPRKDVGTVEYPTSGSASSEERSEESESTGFPSPSESMSSTSGAASATEPGASSDISVSASMVSQSSVASVALSSTSLSSAASSATPTVTKSPTPATTTRAKLDDVGSHVQDGYFYFSANTKEGGTAIYRKKLGSQEAVERMVLNAGAPFDVLNGFLYFSRMTGLYRMNLTTGEEAQLYNKSYGIIRAAGLWIFGVSNNQLMMIRLDGSSVRKLSPGEAYDHAAYYEVYGFDHGYCYYFAQNQFYQTGKANIGMLSVHDRIDYRSPNPVSEDFPLKFQVVGSDVRNIVYDKLLFNQAGLTYKHLPTGSTRKVPEGLYILTDNYVSGVRQGVSTATGVSVTTNFLDFWNTNTFVLKSYELSRTGSYSLDYQDEKNDDLYYVVVESGSEWVQLIRFRPDGTRELISDFDSGYRLKVEE